MDLTNKETWDEVKGWLITVGIVVGYFVMFGLTMLVYQANAQPETLERGGDLPAAFFWPVTLPLGLAMWFPLQTAGVALTTFATATLLVLRARRNQLKAKETDAILRDAGL